MFLSLVPVNIFDELFLNYYYYNIYIYIYIIIIIIIINSTIIQQFKTYVCYSLK